MENRENHIIQNFINGTLDDNSRLKITKEINSLKKSDDKNIMKNNSHKFNTDAAWNNLHKRINETKQPNSEFKPSKKHFYKLGKIAASVLLILGLSVSGYFIFFSEPNIKINSENTLKTIILPDGSEITLNINSDLSYPEKFKGKTRTIKFEGEAFFNIRKNPRKPFIIKTNKAQIKVLGTSFNVNTGDKITEVVVKTGKVEFKNTQKNQNKLILTPGEKGILNAKKLYKTKNNNPNYLSWKTHFFTYENAKLKTIISDINKVYHVNITFRNNETGEIITGKTSFNNYEIDKIIKIICETHHLKSKRTGDNIILF